MLAGNWGFWYFLRYRRLSGEALFTAFSMAIICRSLFIKSCFYSVPVRFSADSASNSPGLQDTHFSDFCHGPGSSVVLCDAVAFCYTNGMVVEQGRGRRVIQVGFHVPQKLNAAQPTVIKPPPASKLTV
jgi:hypothetical protein